ncbi:MAG: GGDEF domain-containing protein [Holophagales bacterium]|nr:MAG: GGDEF domain-containing protein [Holophagales bacterium]
MIRRLLRWLERQPLLVTWFATGVAIAALGLLDFVTGFEVSFSLFYLAPVALAAWRLGRRGGFVAATASTVASMLANALSGERSAEWVTAWNALSRAGIYIVLAELLAELRTQLEGERTLARTDELTGLANRRAFFAAAEAELVRVRRGGRTVSLLFVDLDDFKGVNDRLGHASGDEVLCAVASALRRATRGNDLTGRLGGDEFAALLPDADAEAAQAVTVRLRARLREALASGPALVTVSVGSVTSHSATESIEELLAAADGSLYEAKGAGGDCDAARSLV